MPSIRKQVHIEARPTSVFRFCHDPDRRPEWDERVSRMKILTPKPIRRGTVVRVDAQPPAGDVFSWEGEFKEYHFPSSSRLEVIDVAPSSHFVEASEEWDFRRSDNGTDLTVLWEYRPRGILGRLLDAAVRRSSTARAIAQSLENLKSIVEDEAAAR
jgi:uncharacterized protein YndB with AHSA1/START domain